MYFERGTDISGLGVVERVADVKQVGHVHVVPSITSHMCTAVFDAPAAGYVKISLYDVTGRCIEELHSGTVAAGKQTIDISAAHLSNGTYFVVLETATSRQTAKFTVVR